MSTPAKLSDPAEKTLRKAVWVVTVLVLALVGMMRNPRFHLNLPAGVDLGFLPAVHAVLNSLVAICLILANMAVKRGNILRHRRFINAAVVLSGLFLLGYVAYHFTSTETRFTATGWIRPVYFFLLITHIALAAISFPFILLAYLAGWADRRADHRRLVKFVFPMWFYVAVTGPVVYLLLYVFNRP
jgi:putative membrane protein